MENRVLRSAIWRNEYAGYAAPFVSEESAERLTPFFCNGYVTPLVQGDESLVKNFESF